MSEHRDEHIDWCAAYALGGLDQAERIRLDEHLALGCHECDLALAGFSNATVLLAAAAPMALPAAALRARVLRAIGAPDGSEESTASDVRRRVIELPRRRGAPWLVWVPALAAAALAVTTALLMSERQSLRDEIAARRTETLGLTARLAEEQRLNEVLSAPGARVAVLEITPQGEQALRARATYDPKSRSAVVIFENFRAPTGKDYQLWALHGATPASLGVIKADASGRAIVRLADAGDPATLAAFAVSLEPEGGSPNPAAPSGPVVMLGKLGG